MPAPYNLTNLTGSGNLVGMVTQTNHLVNNMFGIFWLLIVFIVVFVALKNYYTKNAFFAASWVTALNSIAMFLLGWVSQSIMMMCIVLAAIAIVWLFVDSN